MEEFTRCEMLLVHGKLRAVELAISTLEKENWACDIAWAQDGEQALDYLFCRGPYAGRSDTPPLLVLLDLEIPKLSGMEVLREIKRDERIRRIPVVVICSSNNESDLRLAYDVGANSCVIKPSDFADLAGVIRSAGHYWMTVNRRTPP